jgi:hypothetical protein
MKASIKGSNTGCARAACRVTPQNPSKRRSTRYISVKPPQQTQGISAAKDRPPDDSLARHTDCLPGRSHGHRDLVPEVEPAQLPSFLRVVEQPALEALEGGAQAEINKQIAPPLGEPPGQRILRLDLVKIYTGRTGSAELVVNIL